MRAKGVAGAVQAVKRVGSGRCDQTMVAALQQDRSCLTETKLGPVYVRDGLLSFLNPNL